ncbi:MAG: PP2C family protein-serine/threonine phosphatase [Candidatus Acidiferrales bacterium]
MVNSKSMAHFLENQGLYLLIAAVVGAIFWAFGLPINPFTVVLYSLCIGNLLSPPLNRMRFLYDERSFPYNWLVFVSILSGLMIPVYLITSVIVWWIAPPFPMSLKSMITQGWKFPFLVVLVFGGTRFVYNATKERLERRNLELQRSVEAGAARLESQEQELQRAQEIQQSLLPKEIPQIRGFDVQGVWHPARIVGGDYFDVLRLGGNRLAICIGDVAGKSISAALLMATVQATVRAFARDSESPSWVCNRVNSVLCGNIAADRFVTLFYGVLDADARTFQYCNAGHPYPIHVSSGSVRMLDQGGAVLGIFPTWKYEDSIIKLNSGDRLLLFTDGITEAAGSDGREFGMDNVTTFAKANITCSASELNSALLAQVTDFCGAQFQDDVTLIVMAVN